MNASRSPRSTTPGIRTYVLDTSVLLSDPRAFIRFDEHEVVLPLVVIGELEGKRHHAELGWFAREALRLLDDLRVTHGRLDVPVPIGELGGTLHVELNHADPAVLPAGFRTETNDSRILACALNLVADGRDVTLVTKDMPLRVRAGAVGLPADEYRALDVVPSGWTGMSDVEVGPSVLDELYKAGVADLTEHPDVADLPCNTGLRLLAGTATALGRITA
ncbi:MAG TPA: PIN domain-containing protein, partial [Pseudonocardiaceae bacterium]|nr:PIN domain-containing protein [Pseudonocardiaceae bacterium]